MIFQNLINGTVVTFHRLSQKGKLFALNKGYAPAIDLPVSIAPSDFWVWKEWLILQGLEIIPIRLACREAVEEFWEIEPSSEDWLKNLDFN